MKIVIYQVGCDVLGFPIYVEHHIYTGETKGSRINPIKKKWLVIEEKLVKQH